MITQVRLVSVVVGWETCSLVVTAKLIIEKLPLILWVTTEQHSVSIGRDSVLFACVILIAAVVESVGW